MDGGDGEVDGNQHDGPGGHDLPHELLNWTERGAKIFSPWKNGQEMDRKHWGEIVKKAISCKLAEAHGNRTHLGTPSRPHTGFEVREPHQ
jgi:hypothetical protein